MNMILVLKQSFYCKHLKQYSLSSLLNLIIITLTLLCAINLSTVNSADVNVAFNRSATQSSTYGSLKADLAVDGNYNTNSNRGFCASTNDVGGLPNWWR